VSIFIHHLANEGPLRSSQLQILHLQIIQLFDSWAHHLSPKQFTTFSWPYVEQVISKVKAQRPDVPLIFHANGGTGKLHIIAQRHHQDVVVGLDWATEMHQARSLFGDKAVLQVI
jgi:uroporphyrinogen-III decarboxylase